MARIRPKDAARLAQYARRELARDGLNEGRRRMLEEKLDFYSRVLVGRCRMCGRQLTDLDSIAQGYGPECRARVTVAEAEGWWTPRDAQYEAADDGAYDEVAEGDVAYG